MSRNTLGRQLIDWIRTHAPEGADVGSDQGIAAMLGTSRQWITRIRNGGAAPTVERIGEYLDKLQKDHGFPSAAVLYAEGRSVIFNR